MPSRLLRAVILRPALFEIREEQNMREWETVEYAADAMAQGRNKALIVIGHVPSEQSGMEGCTRWLKGFVKKVPVEFVAAMEPFWAVSDKNERRGSKARKGNLTKLQCLP